MKDMAQEIYDRVLQSLVQHLKESGLTQEELADKCDMTQPTIHRLMAGHRGENLPFRTVLNIAVALDIDLSVLISPHPIDKQEKLKTLLAEIGKMIVNE